MKRKKIYLGILIFLIVVTVILSFWWFVYSISNTTIYKVEYEAAQRLRSQKIISYDGTPNGQCNYPECTQEAVERVYLEDVYPDIMPKGVDLLMKLPNKAGFQLISDSFTYTEKKEHTIYDTNTYLIPQGDGRIRIETKTDKFIVHTNNGRKTVNYISYEGHYCSEHSAVAYSTWHTEVEETFITKNPGYYFYEYGIWASFLLLGITAIWLGVCYKAFWKKIFEAQ